MVNRINTKKTHEQFVAEIAISNPTVEIVSNYINAKSKIECKCKICGYRWSTKANNIQQGQKCPDCARINRNNHRRITQKQFTERVKNHAPYISIIGNYVDAHTKVEVLCTRCNHRWFPIAWDIIRGTGCPNCSHTSTSFMEQFILHSFKKALGDSEVISRDKTTIDKELDVYIPKFKFAIEPGSWFWHKNSIENDILKQEKCNNIGIRLVRIYDSYTLDINNETDIYKFREDLSTDLGYPKLKQLVIDLAQSINININWSEEIWTEIKYSAILNSRKRTTEEFINSLKSVNSNIIVLGEYSSYHKKINVKCNICNYEWSASPAHLLQGRGCPKCAGVKLKTNDEFLNELITKNIPITPKEKYKTGNTQISVQCNKCGHQWRTRPANILTGYGCPQCSRKNRSNTTLIERRNNFLNDFSNKGDKNVIIIGEYRNSTTKMLCSCKKCGYQWEATPNSLLQGNGCHKCKGGIKKSIICITTNEEFESISQAAKKYHMSSDSIIKCCKGQKDSIRGLKWKYK